MVINELHFIILKYREYKIKNIIYIFWRGGCVYTGTPEAALIMGWCTSARPPDSGFFQNPLHVWYPMGG